MSGEKPGGLPGWPLGYTVKDVERQLEEERKRKQKAGGIVLLKGDVKSVVATTIKRKR